MAMQSREELLSRATELLGHPEAIEAFWDGGTVGWFVVLAAIFGEMEGVEFKYKTVKIASLRGEGGDIRLFNGQVPPWPEAQLAQDVGQEIAAGLGVPFYFASPNYPEDDCPRWWQRDQAYPCRSCGLPLLQTDPCPWRGLCYQCHLAETRRAKNQPNSNGG